MIHELYSDCPTFKTLRFQPGMNVILAEKGADATDRQTRNRAGKSSTVELMHFLLGGSADKGTLFRNPELAPYVFGMDFDVGAARVQIERTGSKPSPVFLNGEVSTWGLDSKETDRGWSVTNDNWKKVLGAEMFHLTKADKAWSPSFRSLISYFIRRERSGGFRDPVKQSEKQMPVDQQVSISFLLGLDWEIPQEWQSVRSQEKALGVLKKSLKDGALGDRIQKASVLKTQVVLAKAKVDELKQQVESFEVLDTYHDLEKEASNLTRQLGKLADENTLDRRYISELEQATVEEMSAAPVGLKAIYEEAGVVLPDLVAKRFEEVELFHESVVRNRRSYLASEVEVTKAKLAERVEQQKAKDERRAEVMSILQKTGALEHFAALQAELGKAEATHESLRKQHEAAVALESDSLRNTLQRTQLKQRLVQDYSEQDEVIQDAILTFQKISSALYEDDKSGSLNINPTENGPEFSIQIHGSDSKGVNNMQIFCFDMMLTLLAIQRGRSPGFLVHDSHLFDGVDERQVAKALNLGAELAEEHAFQYIVAMNSDEVPPGFSVDDYAIETRFSDATEDGGLFGFRFE